MTSQSCNECERVLCAVPSICYRDNSVHLYDCSPFWVGIFITLIKENYHVFCLYRHPHSDWQSTETQESLILRKHGHLLLSLTLMENTISNIWYSTHIVEIPTQKGEHSWKCTELSLKRKKRESNVEADRTLSFTPGTTGCRFIKGF